MRGVQLKGLGDPWYEQCVESSSKDWEIHGMSNAWSPAQRIGRSMVCAMRGVQLKGLGDPWYEQCMESSSKDWEIHGMSNAWSPAQRIGRSMV